MIIFLVGFFIFVVGCFLWGVLTVLINEEFFDSENKTDAQKSAQLTKSAGISFALIATGICTLMMSEISKDSYTHLTTQAGGSKYGQLVKKFAADGKISRFEYIVLIVEDEINEIKSDWRQDKLELDSEKSRFLKEVENIKN